MAIPAQASDAMAGLLTLQITVASRLPRTSRSSGICGLATPCSQLREQSRSLTGFPIKPSRAPSMNCSEGRRRLCQASAQAYSSFKGFFLPDWWRSRRSLSIYRSVVAMVEWPASSRTCSRGRIFTSSEIPVWRSQ